MNKREYLSKLREYLAYELPERYVQKNLDYYSEYIDTEVAGGRSLPAVLDDLGDPQLIARSIIDAEKAGPDGIPNTGDDPDFSQEIYGSGNSASYGAGGNSYGGQGGSSYSGSGSAYGSDRDQSGFFGGGEDSGGSWFGGPRIYNLGCLPIVLFLLVLFCVISLLGGVVGALSPVLAPIAMVLLVMWLLNRRS